MDTSQRNEALQREQIAFAALSFNEKARCIMAERNCDGGDGATDGVGMRGSEAGRSDWDRRLTRSNNFLQLCRDDLCGKMKTLKVYVGLFFFFLDFLDFFWFFVSLFLVSWFLFLVLFLLLLLLLSLLRSFSVVI